jgi:hypothetical protein
MGGKTSDALGLPWIIHPVLHEQVAQFLSLQYYEANTASIKGADGALKGWQVNPILSAGVTGVVCKAPPPLPTL